jgi:signal peptidase II
MNLRRRGSLWSPRGRVFWPLLFTLLIADCSSKEWAETHLPEYVPQAVFGDAVRLTLAHNRGAAMSFSLGQHSRLAFSLLSIIAVVVLWRLYVTTSAAARLRAAALALVMGGALGNLGNRLLSPRGVTDFIDVGTGEWRFWTFNVADAGLTVGAALLFLALWREQRKPMPPAANEHPA